MKTFLVIGILLLFGFVCGCNSGELNEPVVPTNAGPEKIEAETALSYAYSGFNRDGVPVVRGQLSFVFGESGHVAGRWQLRPLVDTNRIGPQHGTGRFTGTMNSGTLTINLNPQFIDNNVILSGSFTRTGYSGRWQWVGFPGVMNGGTFRAVRVRAATVAEDFTN